MIFGIKAVSLFIFNNTFSVYRGSPMAVGTLEEIIDDNHAIVSTSVGSEHYVTIMSFVDKDQLEPGCTVLLNHKVDYLIYHVNYFPVIKSVRLHERIVYALCKYLIWMIK